MRKKDVRVGDTYHAKVSGVVVPVTILRVSLLGGWEARNERTGRAIWIRSAQRLRGRVS